MVYIIILLCLFSWLFNIPIGICVLLFVFGGIIIYLLKGKIEKKEHIIISDGQIVKTVETVNREQVETMDYSFEHTLPGNPNANVRCVPVENRTADLINSSEEMEKRYFLQRLLSGLLERKGELVRGLSVLGIEETMLESLDAEGDLGSETDRINKDDSIIDVTGKVDKIEYKNSLEPSSDTTLEVPYWAHIYVYSTRELEYASSKCRYFYKQFKKAF